MLPWVTTSTTSGSQIVTLDGARKKEVLVQFQVSLSSQKSGLESGRLPSSCTLSGGVLDGVLLAQGATRVYVIAGILQSIAV